MPVSFGAVEYCDNSCTSQLVCNIFRVQKQYSSRMIALFKLVRSKQIRSLGLPLLLSVDATKIKLFIHGVASWTGLMTPASIFSMSWQKVCFKWTGMGLQGVCLGVMDRLRWIWYGSPGNLPMPLKSSGYCSWICSFDFTIWTLLGVFPWGTVEWEVGRMDVVDCACTSFWDDQLHLIWVLLWGEDILIWVWPQEVVVEKLFVVTREHYLLPFQYRSLLWWVVLWLCLAYRKYICQWDQWSVLYTLWDLCHSLLSLLYVDHWILVDTHFLALG